MQQAVWPGTVLSELSVPGFTVRHQECEWPQDCEFNSPETVLVLSLSALPKGCKTRYSSEAGSSDLRDVGQVVLMPYGVSVLGQSTGGRQQSLCFSFDTQRDGEQSVIWGDWSSRRLEACLNIRNERVDHTLALLRRELAQPGLAAETLVESLGIYLSVELARTFEARDQDADLAARGGLPPWQIKRIAEYVADNLAEAPTISCLAKLFGLSRRHLSREFRRTTGETLCGYVERMRLSEAQRLLAGTSVPLKEVAARLGYSTPSAFSVAFRRSMDISPSDYRMLSVGSPCSRP